MKIFKKENTGKQFSHYFIELLLVIIGISIAFYLNNVSQKRELKQKKQTVASQIYQELSINYESLKDVKEEVDEVVIYLDSVLKNDPEQVNINFGSLLVRNSSFEVAKYSGIIYEFDLDLINEITSIYKLFEVTAEMEDKVGERYFDNFDEDGTFERLFQNYLVYQSVLSSVLSNLEEIDKTLLELEKEMNR